MDIVKRIKELKKEKNAVILAHNYQIPEVQDIADFVGDSLGLSIEASKTKADMIVFCGVYFMAETAKILSPKKIVVIPDRLSGCPMADMITAKELKELKAKHPNAKVLCYVNTTAEVKAECDLCCTSANAIKMVNNALKDAQEIIFIPDKYLADYVSKQTGRKFIVWQGYCPTHVRILPEDILEQKRLHPKAEVIVHPECAPQTIAVADKALSTEGMCKYIKSSDVKEIIVGTEEGIIHRLKKENPEKIFYKVSDKAICPNMKKNTLEKVLWALEEVQFKIELSDEIIKKASLCIQKMLDFSE